MLSTLPAAASPADSARGTRASEAAWKSAAEQARTTSAAAAGSRDPAVINHVRALGSSSAEPAERTQSTTGAAADSGKTDAKSSAEAADSSKAGAGSSPEKPDKDEEEQLRKLKARDAEVRAHEQAHAATGGAFAGAPSYEFQRGPDGRNYAVGGEVPIDVSAISGDPEATIRKMQQVQRAALAPPDPSGADRAIASTASAMILAARRELITEDPREKTGAEPNGATQSTAASGGAPKQSEDTSAQRDAAAGQAFNTVERRSAGAAAYQSSSSARG